MKWAVHKKSSPRERGKYKYLKDELAFVANKRGEVGLTRRSYEELGEPRSIQFVTDANGRGGFRACADDDVNGYKVQDVKHQNVVRIACKSVSTKYKLYDKVTDRVYMLKKEGSVLVFDLNQGFTRM